MKNVLYDKRVGQKFRYFDGKPFILNYYEVVKAPNNIRCIEDLLFLVVRKYGVSLDMVEGSDKEGADPMATYVIKVPLEKAVKNRLEAKYRKFKDGDTANLNAAEIEFFRLAAEQKNEAGQRLPIAKIPLNLGNSQNSDDELSPLNMPGFQK